VKKIVVCAAVAASLVAMPVLTADAKPGKSGKSAKAQKSKRCKKPRRLGFVVRGSLASFDSTSVTLDVARANRHARRYLESNAATFATADARVRFVGVTDTGTDGVGFEDVASSDRVRVLGKLLVPKRRCEGDTSLVVKKIKVVRPEPEGAAEAAS
jgi:hypothetical protein